jgi:uncharacterized membrane protein
MNTPFSPALVLHIASGLILAVAGLLPLCTPKGSRAHRRSGHLFAGLMSLLLATAWAMTLMRFNAYFAALSATATLTIFSGVRVLRRKRPDLDPKQRAMWLDWSVTVAVLAVGMWVLALLLTGRATSPKPTTIALVYACFVYGGWDVWRFIRPAGWPFSPDLWTYEHLVKMLSAYGAVLSAFSGNFLTFLPTPWSQLWPTLLFQPVAIVWIAALAVRRKRLSPA